jgi:hypothetical protein
MPNPATGRVTLGLRLFLVARSISRSAPNASGYSQSKCFRCRCQVAFHLRALAVFTSNVVLAQQTTQFAL